MTPLELKQQKTSEKFKMSSRGGIKLHNYGKSPLFLHNIKYSYLLVWETEKMKKVFQNLKVREILISFNTQRISITEKMNKLWLPSKQ